MSALDIPQQLTSVAHPRGDRNGNETAHAGERLVHQLVGDLAATAPETLAVAGDGGGRGDRLTYGELDRRANQLANHLRTLGVGPEVPVGVCLPRSPGLIVAALGILEAGGAYLPLDPGYPEERRRFMLEDSGAPVLVTGSHGPASLPAGPWRLVEMDRDAALAAAPSTAPPESRGSPEDLAYVIYTSGSTGRPKGVQVTHGSLLNLVSWHQRAFEVTALDRATQVASPSFDGAVWEIWPYLTAGASVHVPAEATRTAPAALRDWLLEQAITISFLPTPLAEAVMALEWPVEARLRLLLTGGDVLHRRPPAGLPFKLVNNYGPTEGTVVTTSGVVTPGDSASLPSIGRPIDNVRVHVLDEALRPVPVGEPGELCVAGAGLARGYLKRPQLTAERFLTDVSGERIYRSGDLVRRRPDGELEFLGRLDEQVKIRGFRIELHEIVAVLDAHPAVEASAVIAREDGGGSKRLVAYVVPASGQPVEAQVLKGHLARLLPEYMVPAVYLELEELPLTANGKLDREALPDPEASRDQEASGTRPRTPLEAALSGIVCDLLGLGQVGVEENFFVLGGHSLLGAQLIARIRDRFGVELSLRTLFDHPTLESMAAAVEEQLIEEIESLSEEEAERRLTAIQGSQG
jgi:amino acid adenylation domain-containing protein